MFKFNENYYLRKCFFEREQVPTQSVMIKKMSPPLATVYFKSMTPKIKVLAGLEPPMKGGGSDWFIPPINILQEGRVVMKPIKKEHLSKLSYMGIGSFGEKLVQDYHRQMEEEKNKVLLENDINWKKTIEVSCRQQWDDSSREAAKKNTEKIQQAFQEFTTLYMTSVAKIELILFDAAVQEIRRVREEAYKKMSDHYETLLKQQATMLYDRYEEKLRKEKSKLKAQFIEKVESSRTAMADQIHDINVKKHVAIEKLRQFLECQNLACQVYVALKERDECQKEMELSKHEHTKKVKALTEQIALKEFEIRLAKEKERKRLEFNRIWQEKVCHVVKKFQLFVQYCLNSLPEHAEFFINMEKLMMLQLNEAMENPHTESIFEPEEQFHTPVPKPHPFFLFCDKGYKPQPDQNLCPKHCTSSASQLPVIVINKKYIYAGCDTFEMFTNKMKEFLQGRRGDDMDFEDDHVYTYDIPVKYTSSQQLLELKLESSLLQVLQKELPNVKEVPIECCVCKIPYCFCSPLHASKMSLNIRRDFGKNPSLDSVSSGNKVETRSGELEHEREPKWESYLKYVEPKKCKCAKSAKKHLQEHLPAYMRNMSLFDAPDLPDYEKCSLTTLKKLVKKARGKRSSPPEPVKVPSKTKDVSTQYSDQEFEFLCTCFSDEEVDRLFKDLIKGSKLHDTDARQFQLVDGDVSPSYLSKNTSSFATQRAFSLRNLMDDSPQLEEIFRKNNCSF